MTSKTAVESKKPTLGLPQTLDNYAEIEILAGLDKYRDAMNKRNCFRTVLDCVAVLDHEDIANELGELHRLFRVFGQQRTVVAPEELQLRCLTSFRDFFMYISSKISAEANAKMASIWNGDDHKKKEKEKTTSS